MLTSAERRAVRLAGELYCLIRDEVCDNGPTRDDDLAEVRACVHHVQNWVKAQAAARLYPGELRLMGEVVGGGPEAAPKPPAVALLEEALHLLVNGERAPGGDETWGKWGRKAEVFLRSLLPEPDARP